MATALTESGGSAPCIPCMTWNYVGAAARMAEVADPEEGLRVESASRLDWDRDRWLRRPLNAAVNPVKADSDFMSKFLFLLRKVTHPLCRGLMSLAEGQSCLAERHSAQDVWHRTDTR